MRGEDRVRLEKEPFHFVDRVERSGELFVIWFKIAKRFKFHLQNFLIRPLVLELLAYAYNGLSACIHRRLQIVK